MKKPCKLPVLGVAYPSSAALVHEATAPMIPPPQPSSITIVHPIPAAITE